jgi:N-acetylglucosaminyl-diphospho-decaprenol L-rhamnosyltransferase
MTRVAVGIINWNTREELRRCLASLEPEARAGTLTVVVVDNASSDGSAAMVEAEFEWATLVANPENAGFAAGVNAALTSCPADYTLILNPDVEVPPGAVGALVGYLEDADDVVAVSPVLVGGDGQPQAHLYRRFPSLGQLLLFWTGLAWISRRIPALRRRYLEHALEGERPITVDQLPGAAILVPAFAVRQVGLFDPGYFIWFEDVDWCYRARQAGYTLAVLPWVRVRHEGGASFRPWSVQVRATQFYRAFFRFLCKHRLDRIRRWAVPLLTVDLLVKDLALDALRLLGWRGVDSFHPLRPIRQGIREIVARHDAGELVYLSPRGIEPRPPVTNAPARGDVAGD